MKIRNGFVGNSSSSSFLIQNLTNEPKTIFDFAKEVLYLVDEFNDRYSSGRNDRKVQESGFLDEKVLSDNSYYCWKPNETIEATFGDESRTDFETVLDYMLRSGGKTESFSWKMISCRGMEY